MDRPGTAASIAATARAAGPRSGGTTVVAIDGPAGSGKTSLAAALAPHLGATVVHMDDLYHGWDGLADSGALLNEAILLPLSRGRAGRYRRYDWHQGRRREEHRVEPGGFVLIEGVGSVRTQTHRFYTTIVWVHAPDELRLQRSVARDGPAAEPFLRTWMRQEEQIFTATGTAALADIYVDAWGRIESRD